MIRENGKVKDRKVRLVRTFRIRQEFNETLLNSVIESGKKVK